MKPSVFTLLIGAADEGGERGVVAKVTDPQEDGSVMDGWNVGYVYSGWVTPELLWGEAGSCSRTSPLSGPVTSARRSRCGLRRRNWATVSSSTAQRTRRRERPRPQGSLAAGRFRSGDPGYRSVRRHQGFRCCGEHGWAASPVRRSRVKNCSNGTPRL